MEISFLADHPEFIATLAPWLTEYWRPLLPLDTLETRVKKLKTHLNDSKLPIAWVAHSGVEVYGTAALRIHDLPDYPDLTPWLGGVYVAPQYRRRGIGENLCTVVEQYASDILGVDTLYLFTLDKQAWYRHLGWSTLQPCNWCEQPGDIMLKKLNSAHD